MVAVFANLLNNAVKYTDHGGSIDVILENTRAEYVVRVRGSGIGIPAGMQRNIFILFAQITYPLERSQGGLGIGISLVEGLVKMLGGIMRAFSAGPGRGSEFSVHLPKDPENKAQAPVPAVQSLERGQTPAARRILVVDDNVDAANTVAKCSGMKSRSCMTGLPLS
jgi:K+-sensing histidine kinase KdpD